MGQKRNLDFTVDLIPVISLLSVCICFLLITAVWVRVGSMKIKQGIGGQSAAETVREPIAVFKLGPKGELQVSVRDFRKNPSISGKGKMSWDLSPEAEQAVKKVIEQLKVVEPDLRSAIIEPNLEVEYQTLISLMDTLKGEGLSEIGIVPL